MILLSAGTLSSAVETLTVCLLLIAVLLITWAVTKWTGTLAKGQSKGGENIEVLETCRIAQDKYVQIIRTGNKVVSVAVSKDSVTMLAELDPDSVETVLPAENGQNKNSSFKELFQKVRETKKDDQ